MAGLGPLLSPTAHQAVIKVAAGWHCNGQRLQQRRINFQHHSGCWENSFPFGCMTEVSVFLLALSQQPLLATGGGPQFPQFLDA